MVSLYEKVTAYYAKKDQWSYHVTGLSGASISIIGEKQNSGRHPLIAAVAIACPELAVMAIREKCPEFYHAALRSASRPVLSGGQVDMWTGVDGADTGTSGDSGYESAENTATGIYHRGALDNIKFNLENIQGTVSDINAKVIAHDIKFDGLSTKQDTLQQGIDELKKNFGIDNSQFKGKVLEILPKIETLLGENADVLKENTEQFNAVTERGEQYRQAIAKFNEEYGNELVANLTKVRDDYSSVMEVVRPLANYRNTELEGLEEAIEEHTKVLKSHFDETVQKLTMENLDDSTATSRSPLNRSQLDARTVAQEVCRILLEIDDSFNLEEHLAKHSAEEETASEKSNTPTSLQELIERSIASMPDNSEFQKSFGKMIKEMTATPSAKEGATPLTQQQFDELKAILGTSTGKIASKLDAVVEAKDAIGSVGSSMKDLVAGIQSSASRTEDASKAAAQFAEGATASADKAQQSAEKAEESETAAKASAEQSGESAEKAKKYAGKAKKYAGKAKENATNAKESETAAAESEGKAKQSADGATESANKARASEIAAGESAGNADDSAEKAKESETAAEASAGKAKESEHAAEASAEKAAKSAKTTATASDTSDSAEQGEEAKEAKETEQGEETEQATGDGDSEESGDSDNQEDPEQAAGDEVPKAPEETNASEETKVPEETKAPEETNASEEAKEAKETEQGEETEQATGDGDSEESGDSDNQEDPEQAAGDEVPKAPEETEDHEQVKETKQGEETKRTRRTGPARRAYAKSVPTNGSNDTSKERRGREFAKKTDQGRRQGSTTNTERKIGKRGSDGNDSSSHSSSEEESTDDGFDQTDLLDKITKLSESLQLLTQQIRTAFPAPRPPAAIKEYHGEPIGRHYSSRILISENFALMCETYNIKVSEAEFEQAIDTHVYMSGADGPVKRFDPRKMRGMRLGMWHFWNNLNDGIFFFYILPNICPNWRKNDEYTRNTRGYVVLDYDFLDTESETIDNFIRFAWENKLRIPSLQISRLSLSSCYKRVICDDIIDSVYDQEVTDRVVFVNIDPTKYPFDNKVYYANIVSCFAQAIGKLYPGLSAYQALNSFLKDKKCGIRLASKGCIGDERCILNDVEIRSLTRYTLAVVKEPYRDLRPKENIPLSAAFREYTPKGERRVVPLNEARSTFWKDVFRNAQTRDDRLTSTVASMNRLLDRKKWSSESKHN